MYFPNITTCFSELDTTRAGRQIVRVVGVITDEQGGVEQCIALTEYLLEQVHDPIHSSSVSYITDRVALDWSHMPVEESPTQPLPDRAVEAIPMYIHRKDYNDDFHMVTFAGAEINMHNFRETESVARLRVEHNSLYVEDATYTIHENKYLHRDVYAAFKRGKPFELLSLSLNSGFIHIKVTQ